MDKNLFAYTANSHPYPEFISINEESGAKITVTVRGPARPGPYSDQDEGPIAKAELPRSQLDKIIEALLQVRHEWEIAEHGV